MFNKDAGKRKWETLGGPLLQHETVARIAKAHGGGATPAQVLLISSHFLT